MRLLLKDATHYGALELSLTVSRAHTLRPVNRAISID